MISISPYPCINRYNSSGLAKPCLKERTVPNFGGSDVTEILTKGDAALNENRLDDALNLYQEAYNKAPDNVEINRKLGKTYQKLKDYNSAEEQYKKYLSVNKNDTDTWIDLGEVQRQLAKYQEAISSFETALSLDANNDLARRSILEAENNKLSCFSPQKAYDEKQAYAQKNLQEALNMTVEYMTPEYMQDLEDVQIKFGKTASMGGTSNIAQYENGIRTITVSDSYKYAAPQVIAAYLVHESVHAKDKDPYTSIREEQDAYQTATQFWIKYSNGVKDPEMDYAAGLYSKSPSDLSKRVEEIYLLRDPSIAKTSPNHPPEKKFNFSFNFMHKNAATQPIKQYNVIA